MRAQNQKNLNTLCSGALLRRFACGAARCMAGRMARRMARRGAGSDRQMPPHVLAVDGATVAAGHHFAARQHHELIRQLAREIEVLLA